MKTAAVTAALALVAGVAAYIITKKLRERSARLAAGARSDAAGYATDGQGNGIF